MNMDRILVFELNWMGDILFSFPFLRALRKRFPEAYISCVVVPGYADLLLNAPWINDVHVLPDVNSIRSLGGKLAFIRMIRRERYDTCFFLKTSRTRALMAALAGIPRRIGFSGKRAQLTVSVEAPPVSLHRADRILALACAVGIDRADGTYEYGVREEDTARCEELLRGAGGGGRTVIALNPGGNWDAKRWPAGNFTILAGRLLKKYGHIEIALTGAEKDRELAERIAAAVDDERCYSVAGKTSLNELAALFSMSAAVVSADSGPLHLASASGAYTVGIFGPTSPSVTGPRGRGKNAVLHRTVGCAVPCYVEECGMGFECMKAVTVDDVMEALGGAFGGGLPGKEV